MMSEKAYFWMRTTKIIEAANSVGAKQISSSTSPSSKPASPPDGPMIILGHTIRHFAENDPADFILEQDETVDPVHPTKIPVRQRFDFFAEKDQGTAQHFESPEEARAYANNAGLGSRFDKWQAEAESVILVSLANKK